MAGELCIVCEQPNDNGRNKCHSCRKFFTRHGFDRFDDPLSKQEPTVSLEGETLLERARAHQNFIGYLMDVVDGPVGIEEVFHREEFMAWGACRGQPLEVFFPNRDGSTLPAKALCAECCVRIECLDYAMASDIDGELQGIWGGTSVQERRQLKVEGRVLADIA